MKAKTKQPCCAGWEKIRKARLPLWGGRFGRRPDVIDTSSRHTVEPSGSVMLETYGARCCCQHSAEVRLDPVQWEAHASLPGLFYMCDFRKGGVRTSLDSLGARLAGWGDKTKATPTSHRCPTIVHHSSPSSCGKESRRAAKRYICRTKFNEISAVWQPRATPHTRRCYNKLTDRTGLRDEPSPSPRARTPPACWP